MGTFCPSLNLVIWWRYNFVRILERIRRKISPALAPACWLGWFWNWWCQQMLVIVQVTSVLFSWRYLKNRALIDPMFLSANTDLVYYKWNRDELPIADKSWQTRVQIPGFYLPNFLSGLVIQALIHSGTEVAKLVDPVYCPQWRQSELVDMMLLFFVSVKQPTRIGWVYPLQRKEMLFPDWILRAAAYQPSQLTRFHWVHNLEF